MSWVTPDATPSTRWVSWARPRLDAVDALPEAGLHVVDALDEAGFQAVDALVNVLARLGSAGPDLGAKRFLKANQARVQGVGIHPRTGFVPTSGVKCIGADTPAVRRQRLAAGLPGLAALVLSPSLMSPLTSFMNWEMSLNWR